MQTEKDHLGLGRQYSASSVKKVQKVQDTSGCDLWNSVMSRYKLLSGNNGPSPKKSNSTSSTSERKFRHLQGPPTNNVSGDGTK